MSQLQSGAARLRIVSGGETGAAMSDVISFLRTQADSLDDTAKRCTDPAIVAELQYTISELRTQADKLEGQ
jgi:hypothetical protein